MNIQSILARKSKKVIAIHPDPSIREALTLLANHNIGVLVVVDQTQQPVGIFSERDFIRASAKDEGIFSLLVSDLMTREVITVRPQDEVKFVAHIMTEKRIRHLPVMEQGKLVGIVSIGDVVKAQRDHYRGEVDNLEVQVMKEEE